MRLPKAPVAHRWQLWLLVTALFAVMVTALLVWDLTRSLKTVVISETHRSRANAVTELAQELKQRSDSGYDPRLSREELDATLKKTSWETLQFYFDVEGGYLQNDDVIGHSFPTYPEQGSVVRQPPMEHAEVLAALEESRRTGTIAQRIRPDGR